MMLPGVGSHEKPLRKVWDHNGVLCCLPQMQFSLNIFLKHGAMLSLGEKAFDLKDILEENSLVHPLGQTQKGSEASPRTKESPLQSSIFTDIFQTKVSHECAPPGMSNGNCT